MTRAALFAVIGGAVFVVVALAVLTPTVIVGDDHHERGERVRVMHGDWSRFPGRPGQGPDQRFHGGARPAPLPGR